MLLISTRLIKEEAEARGWHAEALDERFLSTLAITPPGNRTFYFDSAQPPFNSASAVIIADNKLATYLIAKKLGIPVAGFIMHDAADPQASVAFLQRQVTAGHELVVKPIDTNHGDGITVGVKTTGELAAAVAHAQEFSKKILLQQRFKGVDCRVLVVNGKVLAAARRDPASVTGDGVHTIDELITLENKHPTLRGEGYAAVAAKTKIDHAAARRYLGETIHEVPAAGERTEVVAVANISKGGEATDITDELHPSFAHAALAIASALDMYLCGVDFLTTDPAKPLTPQTGILLEINATPGLRMHHYPANGTPRMVARAILDGLHDKIASTNR